MIRPRSLLFPFAIALLAGCPPDPPPPQPTRCPGLVGDASKPVQIEPIYMGADLVEHDAVAGAPIDIIRPPQGGRVIFAGVRATNLNSCGLKLSVAFRDPANMGILGGEIRTVNLGSLKDRSGWVGPSTMGDFDNSGFNDFANVAVCPNVTTRDVQNLDTILEVGVTDKDGRKASMTLHMTPRCAQSAPDLLAECLCYCEANYTMDKCFNVHFCDGGVHDNGLCPTLPDQGGGASDQSVSDGARPDGT